VIASGELAPPHGSRRLSRRLRELAHGLVDRRSVILDVADCTYISDEICSLCCSLESACHVECMKTEPVSIGMPAAPVAG
jgi:hypothetical protein